MGLFDKLFWHKKKAKQVSQKAELINPNDLWYTTPTISNEFPLTVPKTKQTEFDIHIHEDDYRQREFLNVNALPLIEVEFAGIRDIWKNHSKKSNDYTLFKKCHVRDKIGLPDLSINFNKLKSILNCTSTGQLIINSEALVNGFALKTDHTTYFGSLINETVTELCICQWTEHSRDEILEINKTFNVLFVNWFHCDLIKDA